MELVSDLMPVMHGTVVASFVGLTILALARAPRAGAAGRWVAAAFATLAVGLSLLWLSEWLDVELPEPVDDVELLAIVAFPYLLLRFTATFVELPQPLEVAVAVAAVVAGIVVAVPIGQTLGLAEVANVSAVLAYWATVSFISVSRLWRASHGQPGVARRRLRLMATAAVVLVVAVLLAVQLGHVSPLTEFVAYVLALASATTFGLGFAPPRPLRLSWRRDEDQKLWDAAAALLTADTAEDIAAELLPPTVSIVGASGAALVDDDGQVIAAHGDVPAVGEPIDGTAAQRPVGSSLETIPLGEGFGDLIVRTSPYTPFFGPEELGLLHRAAAIGGLALARARLLAEERAQRSALDRARQHAEHARGEAERAREEADRANVAKSQFLSRMSHELRTPLNAILGFGQLLDTSALSDDDRQGVRHILESGRHLLALINDVLDLSRIEASALAVSLEPVSAAEVIHDAVTLIRPVAAERAIAITVEEPPFDEYIMTDRQCCRQALLNLLSNAVKYNRDRGQVDVTCRRIDGTLRIAVRDTGSGIELASQRRLFEPFERLDAGTSVEGTGLGLALTKQLVERLGGSIGVHSTPGEGSTFWLDLPTTDAPASPEQAEPLEPGPAPDRDRILVVEGSVANLRVIEAMLRRRPGTEILPAVEGASALALAYGHRPDAIVLDLHLPDLSGHEVLKRLRGDPRTRDIPVIIASADATPGGVRQLRDDGAFAYLTKPLDLDDFLATVDAALSPGPDPSRRHAGGGGDSGVPPTAT